MLSFREVSAKLQELKLPSEVPIIVHASLSKVGEIQGGADTMLGALFTLSNRLLLPTFTYKTMVVPPEGPEDNGLIYNTDHQVNPMASIFNPKLPADRSIGILAEKFRLLPNAGRSCHPIFSFAATNFNECLNAQTRKDPLAPIRVLADQGGWVLLIGVDQTSNTTIHYGEKLAGRRDYIRWALTDKGILEFPGYPGCSNGFDKITPVIQGMVRQIVLGNATVLAIQAGYIIDVTRTLILSDPEALLCDRPECLCCGSVRKDARAEIGGTNARKAD